VPTEEEAMTYPSAYFQADSWYWDGSTSTWKNNSYERILTVLDKDKTNASAIYFTKTDGPADKTTLDKRLAYPVHCIKDREEATP
jgi:hypothetical protein